MDNASRVSTDLMLQNAGRSPEWIFHWQLFFCHSFLTCAVLTYPTLPLQFLLIFPLFKRQVTF